MVFSVRRLQAAGQAVLGKGVRVVVPLAVAGSHVDRVRGDVQRPLIVAPGISITLDQAVAMARANTAFNHVIEATLRSAYVDSTPVTVRLSLPNGLTADSMSRTVMIYAGGSRTVAFRVRGTLPLGQHQIVATATAKGGAFRSGYIPMSGYRTLVLTLDQAERPIRQDAAKDDDRNSM